jgi:hypothetical protein
MTKSLPRFEPFLIVPKPFSTRDIGNRICSARKSPNRPLAPLILCPNRLVDSCVTAMGLGVVVHVDFPPADEGRGALCCGGEDKKVFWPLSSNCLTTSGQLSPLMAGWISHCARLFSLLPQLNTQSSKGMRRIRSLIRCHEHQYFETLVSVVFHSMLFTGRRQGPLPCTKHLFL